MRILMVFPVALAVYASPSSGQALGEGFSRDISAGNLLVDAWIGCARTATSQLATKSQEPADLIAVAVLGACSNYQEKMLQHLIRTKMTVPQADDLVARIKAKMREQIIAQAVTLRAK